MTSEADYLESKIPLAHPISTVQLTLVTIVCSVLVARTKSIFTPGVDPRMKFTV